MFSDKYLEYHIVYNNLKRKKPQAINLEESYIILYGLSLFKINKKKIYIRDIVVEQSYFVFEYKPSKLFPYAAMMGTKNYMIAKLISGKKVKISSNPLLLSGDIFTLSRLAKKMKIKFIDTPKKILKKQLNIKGDRHKSVSACFNSVTSEILKGELLKAIMKYRIIQKPPQYL